MAAVDPSESPKRQKTPEEKVETSGEETGAVESECSLRNHKDETTPNKTTDSPEDVQRASAASDGGCVTSHSEVGVESGAGADKTTCISQEDLTSAEKMAETPASDQQGFDWSETEDDAKETKTHSEEKDKCGMLTLLMYFACSFSLQANPSFSYRYRFNPHLLRSAEDSHLQNEALAVHCLFCSLRAHVGCEQRDSVRLFTVCLQLSYCCDVLFSSRP